MAKYDRELVIYGAFEILVAVISIIGNVLVMVIFLRDRRLRTPTNLYVFSLAITDFLTSAVATPVYVHSMITEKPRDFRACLFVNTLIMMFCTVSIFHLISVSFDRYMAVVWRHKPITHDHGMRHATIFCAVAWIAGLLIGCLPLMGWNTGVPPPEAAPRCLFLNVMKMNYLMFLFFATILAPTVLLFFFYGSIFRAVRDHNDRMVSVHESLDTRMSTAGLQQRTLTVNKPRKAELNMDDDDYDELQQHEILEKRERDASRVNQLQQRQTVKTKRVIFSLLLVIVCFLICWYPLYIMNAIAYYGRVDIPKQAFFAPIILSHLSSAINPFIYARTMPGYKEAFVETLGCQQPHSLSDDDTEVNVTSALLPNNTPRVQQKLSASGRVAEMTTLRR